MSSRKFTRHFSSHILSLVVNYIYHWLRRTTSDNLGFDSSSQILHYNKIWFLKSIKTGEILIVHILWLIIREFFQTIKFIMRNSHMPDLGCPTMRCYYPHGLWHVIFINASPTNLKNVYQSSKIFVIISLLLLSPEILWPSSTSYN